MSEQTLKEMALNDAPQHIIDELKQDQVIEILPMNWETVLWFNDVSDLMRFKPNGACLGLDLQQVKIESDMSQRNFTQEQFKGLRLMSKAAAQVINKV